MSDSTDDMSDDDFHRLALAAHEAQVAYDSLGFANANMEPDDAALLKAKRAMACNRAVFLQIRLDNAAMKRVRAEMS